MYSPDPLMQPAVAVDMPNIAITTNEHATKNANRLTIRITPYGSWAFIGYLNALRERGVDRP
jgi:hypothetical protein